MLGHSKDSVDPDLVSIEGKFSEAESNPENDSPETKSAPSNVPARKVEMKK